MAKISQYPDGGNLQLTDEVVINRDGKNYKIDGENMGAVNLLARLVISANTTFNKATYPGLQYIRVQIVGGGGGSGGVDADAAGSGCANGGGGGEYAEKIILVADLAASETVTIGAGGAGGAAGNNNGSTGGTTSFGSHITAIGGGGGNGGINKTAFPDNATVGGGAGGTGGAGTADLRIAGSPSIPGVIWSLTNVQPNIGGASHLSGFVKSAGLITADEDGLAGLQYGGGASGARSSSNATDRAGASGATGVCIIEVYGLG